MSIADRLTDALMLWENGRTEGAFLCAAVAVAATARRRYPRDKHKDAQAFEQFLTDCMSVRVGVEFRRDCYPVERVLYKWLRCELVHEGGMPIDIEFMPPDDALSVRAGGRPEFVLKLSRGWFHHFISSVRNAPENEDLFGMMEQPPPGRKLAACHRESRHGCIRH